MMKELKNCPCCGSKAVIETKRGIFNELYAENGRACIAIGCTDIIGCGVTMYCHYKSGNYDSMVAVATDRWNRRVANG